MPILWWTSYARLVRRASRASSMPDTRTWGGTINFLRQVSMKSGVPIVVGGGFYYQPFYPAEDLHHERGSDRSGAHQAGRYRPVGAFGEIGCWDEITAASARCFARSARRTSRPTSRFSRTRGFREVGARTARHSRGRRREAGSRCHRAPGESRRPERICTQDDLQAGRVCRLRSPGGPGDARQVPMVVALIDAWFTADNLLFSSDLSTASQLKQQRRYGLREDCDGVRGRSCARRASKTTPCTASWWIIRGASWHLFRCDSISQLHLRPHSYSNRDFTTTRFPAGVIPKPMPRSESRCSEIFQSTPG